MAERGRGRLGRAAREAIPDGSRRSRAKSGLQAVPLALTAAGILAALLLVASDFTAVASVDVANGSCQVIQDTDPALADRCELKGLERNGGAFLALAALAAVMAWGAGIGHSRPAAAALAVIGVLVLGWALLVDLPVTDDTGALGRNFDGAFASAGALALLAGLAGLVRRPSAA